VISDSLPANTHFVAGSINLDPPGAGVEGTEPPILASGVTIAPGQHVTTTFAVTVSTSLTAETRITNTAAVTSTELPTPSMDSVTAVVRMPQVSFSDPVYIVVEDAGPAIVTVTLDAVPFITVTVDYSTSDGTAMAGRDYIATSGRLSFTPGVTVLTFTVPITNDELLENDETITLTLDNPGNASLNGNNPAILTIVDDDLANVAIIHGVVFRDADGDGTRDAGELGIPGVLVTLDGNITTTTDLNGGYTLSTTVTGVHVVVETNPTSSVSGMSDPVSTVEGELDLPGYFSTTPDEIHVDAALGESYQVDFGDMLTNAGFASILGTVFDDADGDGVWDGDELGIPGVLVTLGGSITTTTDLNGSYTFSTTVTGVHVAIETDPDGYFSTTPNEVHMDVALGRSHRVRFGEALASSGFASILGTVFNDADGDGVWDGDEMGISGVALALDSDSLATTGSYGGYTFSTTVPGAHVVVETDPEGYHSTTPNEVHLDVSVGSSYQADFGDVSSGSSVCEADIYEEDDTAAQATIFVVGLGQGHQFCDDATDWVRFSAMAGTFYTITTFSWGQRADTFLALFDTDGHTQLAANDDYAGTTDYSSRIVWQAPAYGVYYLRITNRAGLTGYQTDYDLAIEGLGPFPVYFPIIARRYGPGIGTNPGATRFPDGVYTAAGIITHACPDAYETDDTWQQAQAIESEAVQIHSFDSDPRVYAADKDFVWFDISVGEIATFAITSVTNTQTLMELYDEHGAALPVSGTTQLVWVPAAGGRYYLSVSPKDGVPSFGCADVVGYNLLMEIVEARGIHLPVVTRNLSIG